MWSWKIKMLFQAKLPTFWTLIVHLSTWMCLRSQHFQILIFILTICQSSSQLEKWLGESPLEQVQRSLFQFWTVNEITLKSHWNHIPAQLNHKRSCWNHIKITTGGGHILKIADFYHKELSFMNPIPLIT